MPIFEGTEAAVVNADPSLGINVNTWHGRVRMRYGTSPGVVGLAQDDSVILFPIYKGERALFFNIDSDANTALLTADLGFYTRAADGTYTQVAEARYVAAQAINATPVNVLLASIDKTPAAASGWVGLTFEAADPSDTADVRVVMYYVRD